MNLPIVDRRLAGKGKNTGNVERFRHRYRDQIKKAAEDALRGSNVGGIKDTEVRIPQKDMAQPVFQHAAKGGIKEIVHPGNQEYYKGDKIKRPNPQSGQGKGNGMDGVDFDDFTYHLSREEILRILFDDAGLPNMFKEHLLGENVFKFKPAGIVQSGTPNNLHIVRSMRNALGRRIALDSPRKRELENLSLQFDEAANDEDRQLIQNRIDDLLSKPKAPYIDPIDLRYRNRAKVPQPKAKAVVFWMMDVSGSMEQQQKADAKFFFTLMDMMLKSEYEDVEIVRIRYHVHAKECDEQEFFYGKETGGTYVSSALELMKTIIETRYSPNEWNIYGSLASDGDTGPWADDKKIVELMPQIMKLCQHFFYIELKDRENELGTLLNKTVGKDKNFSMKTQVNRQNLFGVFKQFFAQRGLHDEHHRHAALTEPAIA
jgi:uncharacterized sporulation protein YeaH/YhbH (DUF444 family)